MKAILVLEDGTAFEGTSLGSAGETIGEVVFNTSMSGYQEILTDPSYKGQIVTMTYPLIGNYGVNDKDSESESPHVQGFIVREYSRHPSNWQSRRSLEDFLKQYRIVGIQEIDTRSLVRHIRTVGAMKGIISTVDLDRASLLSKVAKAPGLEGRDMVCEVSCKSLSVWRDNLGHPHVVVYDFGVKHNILRTFTELGCKVTVVPATTSADHILDLKPDGILLSNGPGDPAGVPYAVANVKELIGKKPIFGICFGHQVLARALGGTTYKLKFGHHGGNHPVKDMSTGKVEITVQNHCFAVDAERLDNTGLRITHINLNDNTVEGMEHTNLPILSVQYHPEASPGPHDAKYLFERFKQLMVDHA
jgi:carbamoyl-phosphate synthase small subunit